MGKDVIVRCNGAAAPKKKRNDASKEIKLTYQEPAGDSQRIRIQMPSFVKKVTHLPPRLLDLLEIASYVYSADRLVTRGGRDQVEFRGWSRKFRFIVKVADHEFWSKPEITSKLSNLLRFLGGDASYEFSFESGFERTPESLFDRADHAELMEPDDAEVMLFSGGLDSLAGAFELLTSQTKSVCLVSHKSGSPSTTRTQSQLVTALCDRFPGRVKHVAFNSGLSLVGRAPEETQRTRFFLYTAIAFAVAKAYSQDHITVFENGITSMHFRKRQDLVNARATRTTHPKTIKLLQELFRLVIEEPFDIQMPYCWNTKTDIVEKLNRFSGADLLSSSVSCAVAIKESLGHTHCGKCSQCIDRRFAVHSSDLQAMDNVGIYDFDFTSEDIPQLSDARTVLNDFLFQAKEFRYATEDHFAEGERLTEMSEIFEGLNGIEEEEAVRLVHDLCKRHGEQVWHGYETMRSSYGDPSLPRSTDSLYSMVEGGEPHREPEFLFAERLQPVLEKGIRLAFQRRKPDNEHELNDQIESILASAGSEAEREFPSIPFATKKSIPDHATEDCRVLIEAKYPRPTRTLKAIIGEMEKDFFDFNLVSVILFIVYDPHCFIKNDSQFRIDFEEKGPCRVCVVR